MPTIRYFAAARAAAGVTEEPVAGQTLQACLDEAAGQHGSALTRVLASCSFLVDGLAAGDRSRPLDAAAVIDVLPPFAGG